MTKQGVKGKYQRTLNEKYETYLNSMRRIINTDTHKTKSTNYRYNKVQVIWTWVGQLHFIVIHLVHKQCGCNYHTNAIRTELHLTFI